MKRLVRLVLLVLGMATLSACSTASETWIGRNVGRHMDSEAAVPVDSAPPAVDPRGA
jgi:hypothetical protein